MKKKHGWVIWMKNNHPLGWVGFYCGGLRYSTLSLKNATVFSSREDSRDASDRNEIACKVSLTLKGRAKKVIGKG